jgi:hypothetical protein
VVAAAGDRDHGRAGLDIGYHFGINMSGVVYQGRRIDVKGAHAELKKP